MRARFKVVWGVLMLVAACMHGFAALLGGRGFPLLLAVLFVVIGVLYLVGTPFELDETALRIKNPLGMTLKTYTFDAPTDLEVEDGKVFLRREGERVRVRGVSRMMTNAEDWARFERITRGELPLS